MPHGADSLPRRLLTVTKWEIFIKSVIVFSLP